MKLLKFPKVRITNMSKVPVHLQEGLEMAVATMEFNETCDDVWNSFLHDGNYYDVNIWCDEPYETWYGAIQDTKKVEGSEYLENGDVIATFDVEVFVSSK